MPPQLPAGQGRRLLSRPDRLLDPHAVFTAQGLYRRGVHGDRPSIPWYAVFGNHDRHALGVFPIVQNVWGRRMAPLPLAHRPGIVLPTVFDPLGFFAHGNVTPAEPGPPGLFALPRFVWPNFERAYFDRREYLRAMFNTATGPPGHGFSSPQGRSWYSVPLSFALPEEPRPSGRAVVSLRAARPSLRLIGLDTTDAAHAFEGFLWIRAGSVMTRPAGPVVGSEPGHDWPGSDLILGCANVVRVIRGREAGRRPSHRGGRPSPSRRRRGPS